MRIFSSILVGLVTVVGSVFIAFGEAGASSVPPEAADRLHIKLRTTSTSESEGGGLSGEVSIGLNSKLKQLRVTSQRPLFTRDKVGFKTQQQRLGREGHKVADLSQYFELVLPAGANAQAAVMELKKLPIIAEAYVAPKVTSSSTTPRLDSLQAYGSWSPRGIAANFAATWPGGKGDGVVIAHLDYSWNRNHEDLSKARKSDSLIKHGTPTDPDNDDNHGTMVAGVISADANAFGVTGLVPDAQLKLANIHSKEYGDNLGGTIYRAADVLGRGDVLLIEQQVFLGPNKSGMPLELHPPYYEAIRYATAKGVIVIEPAGNGGNNLDNYGTPFPYGKPDSGAIMVGAGTACNHRTARQRWSDSNYGARVNVQGWGECVVTTGLHGPTGILYNGGVNATYTSAFNGTSAASAVVAAAAASFSSAFEKLNGQVSPTPIIVRNTLMSTGTPQNLTTPGHIGPLPDLSKALKLSDRRNPTAPTNLAVTTNNGSGTPVATWKASTDNVGVLEYRVYRNSVLVRTQSAAQTLIYYDAAATSGKTHQYKVQAVDRAGRISAFSNAVSVTRP